MLRLFIDPNSLLRFNVVLISGLGGQTISMKDILMSQEKKEIRKVIDVYLSAIKTGDTDLFEKAFYPDAVVINAGEEDPEKAATPIADFASRIEAGHKAGKGAEETALEVNISQSGRVANARVDFELKASGRVMLGTDFFNLVKRKNQWKIAQKIYDVTSTK